MEGGPILSKRLPRLVPGIVAGVFLTQAIGFGAVSAQSTGTRGFNDIGGVPWAAQAITAMQERGVLKGTGPGTFDPTGQLNRAQMATALGRLEGWSPNAGAGAADFRDWDEVPTWAQPYVATAAQHNIVEGMPGRMFDPAAILSWDDLAVIVARAFAYPPVPAGQVDSVLAQLPHGPQTPDWAKQAVAEDIVAGDFAGILADLYIPNAPVDRAELALFLDQAAQGLETATSLSLSPTPIAAAGSLKAGQSVSVTVYADNSTGKAVAGADVYLSFAATKGGGSATVNGTALTGTPTAFMSGANGALTVTYTAPKALPAGGTDTLTAATPNGTASVTDTYSFATAPPAVTALALQPTPIASAGSLKAGQSVTTVVYATYSGKAAAGAQVYLSFVPAAGGGTAAVNGKTLTAVPTAFTAGTDGTITVAYTAPVKLPAGGTDTLTAANAATKATVTADDTYTFTQPAPKVTALKIQPTPIAPAGSLAAGQSVTSVVYATYGAKAAGQAQVYLSFTAASGGGSATVGGKALTSTPTAFTAGADGTITVTYTAPAKLPSSGTDTLTAADAASQAMVTASDTYTFAPTGSVTGLSITLKLSSGQTATYVLAPDVTVTKDGSPASLADIGPDTTVSITLNAQGQVSAIQILS